MIEEGRIEVEGVEIFCRRTAGDGTPTVLLHGNPGNSDDWLPFLERMRGPVIAPELPGFGRSERPAHAYTMHGLASFFERLLATLGDRPVQARSARLGSSGADPGPAAAGPG